MAYWNKWSSLLRNGEWLEGEEKKIHMRDNPSILYSALSFWVDKRGATIPLKSFHQGNSGPDISKFDEYTKIMWKRAIFVFDTMNKRAVSL